MNKVFLGGTCAESTWRDEIMPLLEIEYFNPVVEDWDNECQIIEEREKEECCDIHLYVITSLMIGSFSIAEAVESSMTPGKRTLLHIIPNGFNPPQIHSFLAVCNMVIKHGGVAYIDPELARSARVVNAYPKLPQNRISTQYQPGHINKAAEDGLSLAVFEDQVIAEVDPSILELFFTAKKDEIPGALAAFDKVKKLILDGAMHNLSPKRVAYDVGVFLTAYLSIEDIS